MHSQRILSMIYFVGNESKQRIETEWLSPACCLRKSTTYNLFAYFHLNAHDLHSYPAKCPVLQPLASSPALFWCLKDFMSQFN